MTREELAPQIQEQAGLETKAQAAEAAAAIIDGMTESLANGQNVTLRGFGTFSVVERKARTGRNPRTGEAIQIAARKAVRFTPGADLKDTAHALTKGWGETYLGYKVVRRKLDEQMKDVKSSIKGYRKQADTLSGEAKKVYTERLDRVSEDYDAAKIKLAEIGESSSQAWDEMKKGLDKAYTDLRDAFKKAVDKF